MEPKVIWNEDSETYTIIIRQGMDEVRVYLEYDEVQKFNWTTTGDNAVHLGKIETQRNPED